MSGYGAPWALCGGWAVDAWLGRQSREHGDVDIAVFIQDQRALFEHLPGWQLLAHDPVFDAASPGSNAEWWDGRRRLNHSTHIHARPPELSGPVPEGGLAWAKDGFTMEFYLNDGAGDAWLLSDEPRITLPLRACVRPSPWGLPALVPEAVLFFKAAGFIRRRDQLDFEALWPLLTGEQRDWLRAAVERIGHPWLKELSVP
jgi:hypothetical protein